MHEEWVHVPRITGTASGYHGIAVSTALNVIAVSRTVSLGQYYYDDCVEVFAIPPDVRIAGVPPKLDLLYTLGGRLCPPPVVFRDQLLNLGALAFSDPGHDGATTPVLFVADADNDTVHVVDVVGKRHLGYVGDRSSGSSEASHPRGVASRGPLVAVASWDRYGHGDHIVKLFTGGGSDWAHLRTIGGAVGGADGQLCRPNGVSFTPDGTGVLVADLGNGRLSLFDAVDGAFVRHLATSPFSPLCVHEWEDGWVVPFQRYRGFKVTGEVQFLPRAGPRLASRLVEFQTWVGGLVPVPGLGLVIWAQDGMHLVARGDHVAMGAMSQARVAWMGACYKAILCKAA
jgi:hypothetical protein